MELIDIRAMGGYVYNPVSIIGNKVVCEKIKPEGCMFSKHRNFGYYVYEIDNKKLKKLNKDEKKIYTSVVYEKDIEGEDCIYYITKTRQINENDYTLYKIDLDSEEEFELFHFSISSRYPEVMFECLTKDYICVFAKESDKFDFEFTKNFNTQKYGYDIGYLINMDNGEKYEIKDINFLRGLKDVFFKTDLGGEKCIVYEENYLDTWDKEQIYENLKRNKKDNIKNKFYYKDSLKIIPVDKFFQQVQEGYDKLCFYETASRGYEGYEMFYGVDRDNIYLLLKDFDKPYEEMVVFLNRKTMKRKVYTVKDMSHLDERTGDILGYIKIVYNLESSDKGIFALKPIENNLVYVKEVMNGELEYSYPFSFGFIEACIEKRYLISQDKVSVQEIYTNIIDMNSNRVKKYRGRFKMLGDRAVIF